MNPLLKTEHLTIFYDSQPVVKDISFTLQKGEILGIVGESGSGKTSIIKGILGLSQNGMEIQGDIWFQGQKLTEMPGKEMRKLLGPQIGMVFQDCKASLCPVRKVGDQICESINQHEHVSVKEIRARTEELMLRVGLTDFQRIWNSYPFELSGGMNQRVGICMAMLQKPALLLADEPTSALDVTVQKQVVEEMLLLRREYGTSMIIVTHNMGVVSKMADSILVLKEGLRMDYGPSDWILNHSQDPYTKNLMDSVLHLRRKKR